MNKQQKQDIANQIGTQIIALQKIKETLECDDVPPNAPPPPFIRQAVVDPNGALGKRKNKTFTQ